HRVRPGMLLSATVGHKAAAFENTPKMLEARSSQRAGLVNSRFVVDLDYRAPRSPGAAKEKAKVGRPARCRADQTGTDRAGCREFAFSRSVHLSLVFDPLHYGRQRSEMSSESDSPRNVGRRCCGEGRRGSQTDMNHRIIRA